MSSTGWIMVTGSSSGIGETTAMALASQGWNVGLHCRQSIDKVQAVADRVQKMGRKSIIVQADLGADGAPNKLVEDAWRETGGFDAWVHLAGADLLTGAEAKFTFEEKLDLIMRVDLKGTILTCREVANRMMERGSGSIVTIGWDQSATGMEGDSGEIFAAIKGGVAAFTRSLAKSVAPAVRVNCVAPGWIQTAWGKAASSTWQDRVHRETPLKRWGSPEDVARTIQFLVSDEASFLTGQTINVNGGVVTS